MKVAIGILLVVALSLGASGYPHLALLDPPSAATLGDPGRLSMEVGLLQGREAVWLAGGVGTRVDLVASVGTAGQSVVGLRALILEELGPLQAALLLSTDGVSLLAGALLGPVRLDWGRTFGGVVRRGAMATVSLSDRLALVAAVQERGEVWSTLLGVRAMGESGIWWTSAWVRDGSIEIRLGGTL